MTDKTFLSTMSVDAKRTMLMTTCIETFSDSSLKMRTPKISQLSQKVDTSDCNILKIEAEYIVNRYNQIILNSIDT